MNRKRSNWERLLAVTLSLAVVFIIGCPPPQPEPADEPAEVTLDEKHKPTVIVLPEECTTPDGMTLSDAGIIYLNCPNFNSMDENNVKAHNSKLYTIDKDMNVEEIMDYPVLEETGQLGPMGLDFGPDGNLYVADNQFFHTKAHKSRVIRVIMDEEGMPKTDDAGEPIIEVVATGLDLANAVLWHDGNLYVTDTFFTEKDEEGEFQATVNSGVWRFPADEVIDSTEPIVVKPGIEEDNPYIIARVTCDENNPRGDIAGADGMTVDEDGVIYFGNFGDGAFFKLSYDEEGAAKLETIFEAGKPLTCVDGIFYDKATKLIYIDDSEANAIRTYDPKTGDVGLVWMNDDNDGADGSLDQPAECIIRDGKLIMANFDMPFPGLKNFGEEQEDGTGDGTGYDGVHTLSVITLSEAPAEPAEPAEPTEPVTEPVVEPVEPVEPVTEPVVEPVEAVEPVEPIAEPAPAVEPAVEPAPAAEPAAEEAPAAEAAPETPAAATE